MNKKNTLPLIITVILLVTVFFVVNSRHKATVKFDELDRLNTELKSDIEIYRNRLDSVNHVINQYKDSIRVLIINKEKIKSNYEYKLKSFRNANVVSNDSITRYISNKIYNRR